jgi:hypothetical protein
MGGCENHECWPIKIDWKFNLALKTEHYFLIEAEFFLANKYFKKQPFIY